MRIVALSDTHCREREIDIPDGDVLIHAGDATIAGEFFEVRDFAEWMRSLPHKHKIFVAGNHDFLFEKVPEVARSLLHGIHYLQDSEVVIDGVKFYGSPWQPRFHDWAFNVDRGSEIAKKWALIPKDVNVLITHGPPWGKLDRTHLAGLPLGCEELRIAIERVKPAVHIFGHIHGGYGAHNGGSTHFRNVSICDEAYKPTRQPQVFDYEP